MSDYGWMAVHKHDCKEGDEHQKSDGSWEPCDGWRTELIICTVHERRRRILAPLGMRILALDEQMPHGYLDYTMDGKKWHRFHNGMTDKVRNCIRLWPASKSAIAIATPVTKEANLAYREYTAKECAFLDFESCKRRNMAPHSDSWIKEYSAEFDRLLALAHVNGIFKPKPAHGSIEEAAAILKQIKFHYGDSVRKVGGDYTFEGIVVSVFPKLSGKVRYVVEDDRGVLHVYGEKNLEAR